VGVSDQARGVSSDNSDVRPARIVVADDDRIARDLLSGILRNAGHTVETVNDGQEAIERVSQGGFDLVLLDIVMPRLSGLEACRILKSMTFEGFLPVVLVTVKTDTQSRVEGLRIGADDYVCKPFEEQELIARVTSMLRIKRLHDQMALQKAKFERLSVHDELTGLYNYRYLHTRLSEEFKRAERYHEPFACVLVDIDQLRAVNELSGRLVGDAMIRRVADAIRRCVREVDVIARYGGDEFLVVLPSTHFAGSVVVAERIWRESFARPPEPESAGGDARVSSENRRDDHRHRELLDGPFTPAHDTAASWEARRGEGEARWAHGPRELTVSIGVALYPSRDVRSKDALLRAADSALSQAKREGGNRICVFQQQGYIYTPAINPPPRDMAAASSSDAGRSSASAVSSGRHRLAPPDSWRPPPPDVPSSGSAHTSDATGRKGS
jgi:two-component system cell cycle response regulator